MSSYVIATRRLGAAFLVTAGAGLAVALGPAGVAGAAPTTPLPTVPVTATANANAMLRVVPATAGVRNAVFIMPPAVAPTRGPIEVPAGNAKIIRTDNGTQWPAAALGAGGVVLIAAGGLGLRARRNG